MPIQYTPAHNLWLSSVISLLIKRVPNHLSILRFIVKWSTWIRKKVFLPAQNLTHRLYHNFQRLFSSHQSWSHTPLIDHIYGTSKIDVDKINVNMAIFNQLSHSPHLMRLTSTNLNTKNIFTLMALNQSPFRGMSCK